VGFFEKNKEMLASNGSKVFRKNREQRESGRALAPKQRKAFVGRAPKTRFLDTLGEAQRYHRAVLPPTGRMSGAAKMTFDSPQAELAPA
jgi:hypothetical protein